MLEHGHDIGNGFVERADPGTYRLGIRLLELGNVVKSRISIRGAAMPQMQLLKVQKKWAQPLRKALKKVWKKPKKW